MSKHISILSVFILFFNSSCTQKNRGSDYTDIKLPCDVTEYKKIATCIENGETNFIINMKYLELDSLKRFKDINNVYLMITSQHVNGKWSSISDIPYVDIWDPVFEKVPNLNEFGRKKEISLRIKKAKKQELIVDENCQIDSLVVRFMTGGKLKKIEFNNSRLKFLSLFNERGKLDLGDNITINNCQIEELHTFESFENIFPLLKKMNSVKRLSFEKFTNQEKFLSQLKELPQLEWINVRSLSFNESKAIDSLTMVKISKFKETEKVSSGNIMPR